jgi:hypothetical protein
MEYAQSYVSDHAFDYDGAADDDPYAYAAACAAAFGASAYVEVCDCDEEDAAFYARFFS